MRPRRLLLIPATVLASITALIGIWWRARSHQWYLSEDPYHRDPPPAPREPRDDPLEKRPPVKRLQG